MTTRWGLWALLCVLVVACRADEMSTPPAAAEQTRDIPPTHVPEPTATPLPPEPTVAPTLSLLPPASPTPTHQPLTATPLPELVSWYGAGTVVLFVGGDNGHAGLYALDDDGTIRLVFPDVGDEARVSPDGRWLGFVRWREDGRGTLELYDARSGAVHKITPDTTSGMFGFAFDQESGRLAYLDLGAYTGEGVNWALVVVDLESEASTRYEALMAGSETRPLPGVPVGWSGHASHADELIIDTFMPFTEGGWMGVWGVTLPPDVASAPLASLALRELVPGTPAYSSRLHLAPNGQDVAFFGRDPDYVPDNYFPEFYDLAVNRLDLAALDDGARTTVVGVNDGSALARAVAWSPTGERLLFAQGHYDGENLADLLLKSSDRNGVIVTYGPLTLPALGGLLDLAWCDTAHAFYVTWDDGDGMQHLVSFDLNTGGSDEISAGRRLQIVGCAPQ